MERRKNRFEYQNYAPGEAKAGRVEGGRHRDRKYPKIPHPPYPDGPGIRRDTDTTPDCNTQSEPGCGVQIDTNRFKGVTVLVQEWSSKPYTVYVKERETGQMWILPKDSLLDLTIDAVEATACENAGVLRGPISTALDLESDLQAFYLDRIGALEMENEELRRRVSSTEESLANQRTTIDPVGTRIDAAPRKTCEIRKDSFGESVELNDAIRQLSDKFNRNT